MPNLFNPRGLLLLSVFFLNACAVQQPTDSPASQLDVEVRSADTAELDIPAERKSEAMRRFLMAELSLEAEESEDALRDLKVSSNLLKNPDPEVQAKLALLYIRKGDLDSALEELEPVKSDAKALALQASILQSLGRWPEALTAYRSLLTLNPDASEARMMLALDALQSGQYEEGKQLLEPIESKDKNNLPALKLLAFAFSELGNLDRSFSIFEKVRQMDPSDLKAFESFLALAFEQKNFVSVEKELSRESKIRPDSPVLMQLRVIDWRNDKTRQELIAALKVGSRRLPSALELRSEIARLALLRQNYSDAISHYSLLLAIRPEDEELRYTLALALSSVGQSKDAIEQLDNISKSSPWYVRSQSFAGLLYRQKGDFKSAEKSFRNALRVEPGAEQLQSYLASVLKEAGDFRAAKAVFKDLLEKDPNNQRILFSYGVLLHDMKEADESAEVMQRLIGVNPQHAEALNFIAYDLAEDGEDLVRALDLANRAIQLQPENGFFLDTRGWIYFRLGKNQEALADLERSVDITKGDPEIAEHLADVYVKLGRSKEALQVYKDALDRLVDSKEEGDKVSTQRIRNKIEALSPTKTKDSK